MNRSFDVIVVGVGAMGSSACLHLARRGVRVLGLEQFDIPHALGSSHGYSRMIRLAYHEHPHYVPLLRRAYALWRQLESDSSQTLLHETGGIYMGPPDGHVVPGAIKAAKLHGLAHEVLSLEELARRFSAFRVPDNFLAVWEPRAGFLLPERVIAAQAELALREGAALHGRETVLQWDSSGAGVTVSTSRGQYEAKHLLFCGGAWSGKLIQDLGVKLVVTRQVLGWVWPRKPERFSFGAFPVWGIESPDGSLAYGFPMMRDNPGLKVARHAPGAVADPDAVDRTCTPADEREVGDILNRYLPDGDGPLLSMRTCLYTNSPDQHFILDRHPRHDNVTLACGFSGHGFKFASVIGEVLAAMVMGEPMKLSIDFLRLGRFSES